MKKDYFVNLSPAVVVKHRIHKEECPFNDNSGNMISLGSFISAVEALTEAKKLFPETIICPFCSKEFKAGKIQRFSSRKGNNRGPVSSSSIMPALESAFFSAVN